LKGAFQVAKIAGIPVKLHWSFVLMLVWVAIEGRRSGMNWESVGWFAVLMIGVFACVILHEFGHAFSAKRYGVQTKDIILSPLGGVARLDGLPEKPIDESVVAFAGPLVNLLLAGIFGGYGWLTSSIDFSNLGTSRLVFGNPENFVTLFLLINIFLALFNLIPAFPMDGGRIFRSLLSPSLGRRRATLITTYLGQGMAILLVILAYFFVPPRMSFYLIPLFILSSAFMFFMARQEYRMVKFEEILKKHFISELIRQPVNIFKKNDHIAHALEILKRGLEKDFLVKNEDGTIAGVFSQPKIVEVAKSIPTDLHKNHEVEEFISQVKETISSSDSLHVFYKKLMKQELRILPVFENENLIGVVDIQQLNDFLRVEYEMK
jgi:Zn-dependent protease/predicted transcriptional regulator